jgi:hypothetical protein
MKYALYGACVALGILVFGAINNGIQNLGETISGLMKAIVTKVLALIGIGLVLLVLYYLMAGNG